MRMHGAAVSVIPGVSVETKTVEGVHARYQVAECSDCGQKLWLRNTAKTALPREVIFKKLRQHGWSPHKKGRHLCEKCLVAPKPDPSPTKEENVPMPKPLTLAKETQPESPTKVKRRAPEIVTVEAVALVRLTDLVGVPRAAEMLGLSEPPLRDGLRDGEWRKAFERAASDALREVEPKDQPGVEQAEPLHLVVGKIPSAEVSRIVNGAAFLGVELMDLGEL